MSDLTPSYCLTHETPIGHRYAYPAPTVPDELAATSKAAAVAGWGDAARDWAGRFLPDVEGALRACSSCNGRGYHLGGAS